MVNKSVNIYGNQPGVLIVSSIINPVFVVDAANVDIANFTINGAWNANPEKYRNIKDKLLEDVVNRINADNPLDVFKLSGK